MAERPRAMGRGLAAILSSPERGGEPAMRHVAVELIVPNPRQPRRDFDEETLTELAESLRARGVIQPVIVRPVPGGTYELIAGERRWRAAQLAGLETIPAIVRPHDDAESLELALIENMARENLNPVEEARACAALVDELGLTQDEVGKRVGRSRVAIANLLRLLALPDAALELISSGALSAGHGRALLMARDHEARRHLAAQAVTEGWSVRELERRSRLAAESPTPGARRAGRRLHPEQEAAVERIGDAFGALVGRDVRVAPSGSGYRVELAFESIDDALALAERLRGETG